jgi:hypothetical protein
MTHGVLHKIAFLDIAEGITKHLEGRWGALDAEDMKANDDALVHGGRILSKYYSADNVAFYVITEADRSSTTVLLPEEY